MFNVSMDLDMMNRMGGHVVDIVLDERERKHWKEELNIYDCSICVRWAGTRRSSVGTAD